MWAGAWHYLMLLLGGPGIVSSTRLTDFLDPRLADRVGTAPFTFACSETASGSKTGRTGDPQAGVASSRRACGQPAQLAVEAGLGFLIFTLSWATRSVARTS